MGWGKQSGKSNDFLVVKDGEKALISVLSKEPVDFRQVYLEKVYYNLPNGVRLENIRVAQKWAVLAYDHASGTIKVFTFGKKMHDQLKEAWDAYDQNFASFDIILGRKGTNLEDTVWTATAKPTKLDRKSIEALPTPDMGKLFADSSAADIEMLKSVDAKTPPREITGSISVKQYDWILGLVIKKKIPAKTMQQKVLELSGIKLEAEESLHPDFPRAKFNELLEFVKAQ